MFWKWKKPSIVPGHEEKSSNEEKASIMPPNMEKPAIMPWYEEKPSWKARVTELEKEIVPPKDPNEIDANKDILMILAKMLAVPRSDHEAAIRCADEIREYYTALMLRPEDNKYKGFDDHAVAYIVGAVLGHVHRISENVLPTEPNHKRLADVLIEIKKKRRTGPWDATVCSHQTHTATILPPLTNDQNPQLGWETLQVDFFAYELWNPVEGKPSPSLPIQPPPPTN
jgi:hypothetical protein